MIGKIDIDAIEKARGLGISLDSGYLHNKDGRVRLFSRKFPGTSKSGYCLRSRVVWWIYTGEVLSGCEFNIHHKNSDRADDRFSNLEKLTHLEHAHEHNGYRGDNAEKVKRVCEVCNKEFEILKFRLREEGRGKFCSLVCRGKRPRKKNRVKLNCEWCEKDFFVTGFQSKHRRFCSNKCSADLLWYKRIDKCAY